MPKKKSRLTLPKRKPKTKKTVIWEVRAILEERTNDKGDVEYRVDWEPDENGKEYAPLWIAKVDVGLEAIADWEEEKQRRAQPTRDDREPLPLLVSDNLPPKAATGRKRVREESVGSLGDSSNRVKRRRTDVVVEVALPAKPAFDPSDYAPVALASQTTIPDSQEPQDSFRSAPATVGEQETNVSLRSRSPLQSAPDRPSQISQGDASREGRAWTQPPLPPPELVQPHPDQHVSEPASRLNISAAHGETDHLSFGQRQVVTATNSQDSLALPLEPCGTSERPTSSPGFLTQPEFDPYSQPLETSSATVGSRQVIAESNGRSTADESQKSGDLNITQNSIISGSHSAQVVQHLSGTPDELRTLSQSWTPPSQGGVIPASSLAQTYQASVAISSAAAAGRRSVPSDAFVSDTPTRQAYSAPAAGTGPSRFTTPKPPPAQLNQTLARATPSSWHRSTQSMDDIPDPADGGGNLTEYLLALHANTVGKVSAPNRDSAERFRGETPSAPPRAATPPEPVHATAISGDAARSSLPDENLFGNTLGLAATSAASVPMEEEQHHLPATIAPSQMFITESSFHNALPPAAAPPLFRTEQVEQETVLPGIESRQHSVDPDRDSSPSSVARSIEARPNEFLVTLPMLASTRNLYVETIRSSRSAIEKYSQFFTAESAGSPDEQLVSEVDDIFRRLHDHCDLPQYASSIPPLSREAMTRRATGTNCKFLFVYELLRELKDSNMRILVLSQPGVAADNIEAICETEQLNYTELDRYIAVGDDAEGLTVILGTTEVEISDRSLLGVDAVILFDSPARQVWQDRSSGAIVLSLVVANSIEHIDLQLPHNLDDLERRSAIGLALSVSKSVISSPDRMQEPNELAALFADFIKDPAHELGWEPRALPASFFDFYLNSQALESQRAGATSLPNGRKRLLDGDERLSTPQKRARTERPTLTQSSYLMSDLLKDTLASYTSRPQGASQTVDVTIDQLEWMAARISRAEEELRDRKKFEERLQELVKRTEPELRAYKKMVATLQPKHMAAVSERGQFELAKKAAEQRAAELEKELERSRAETQALREKLTARTHSELEAKYEAVQAEREKLEKKLQSAAQERDFFRDRFQEGMGSATELASERDDLKRQVQDLERKASETAVRVHEINSKNASDEHRRQREESQAYIAQLEQQVEQTRKELQTLRSGRRETRATSIPRSPRLNVMSPRTRGGGTSRGTSPAPFDGSSTPSSVVAGPVPGMTFYQPPGSHPRFSHLRE